MQEQIKPHFLYNTFDAISSMAITNGDDEIYKIVSALGSFYRNSLSKGSEIITIRHELDIVRSYLVIQSYRYKDLFTYEIHVSEELLEKSVLKLILQPLVENSVYHGLKPKSEKGSININIYQSEGNIFFLVSDDGIGMEESLIQTILQSDPAEGKSSFGLRKTQERLKLFYNLDDVLYITSKPGCGTTVTIKIPADKDNTNG